MRVWYQRGLTWGVAKTTHVMEALGRLRQDGVSGRSMARLLGERSWVECEGPTQIEERWYTAGAVGGRCKP